MKYFFLTLFLLCVLLHSNAQNNYYTVSGVVVDEKTNQPMQGASVFCQNTTIGTITNHEGKFFLRLANGGYDLVVSFTGYDTKSQRISNGNKGNDSLIVLMKEQDKNMAEVVVSGSTEVADGWAKYGQFFIDNFIGNTPNAKQSSLENADVLHFYFYKKRNKLKVRAKNELLITNNALGYKIKFQLDSFVYDYNNKIGAYFGYPLFEVMNGTAEQQATWEDNRRKTYRGSELQFMRCWRDSTLKDQGFVIEQLDSANTSVASLLDDPYNSKVFSVDSGDVEISIHGQLRITYNGHAPDQTYLQQNNFPSTAKNQISAIDIIGDGFVIEQNGYFYEQSEMVTMGYWGWKKLADLLPYDYVPNP